MCFINCKLLSFVVIMLWASIALAQNDSLPFMCNIKEIMPRFPGCEHLDMNDMEKEECSKVKMLEFVYTNLVCPPKAKRRKVEGICVVQFAVTEHGEIEDIKLVRDIGTGCGEAAVDVVKKMAALEEKWIPGFQNGKKVKVLYTFPIKFMCHST